MARKVRKKAKKKSKKKSKLKTAKRKTNRRGARRRTARTSRSTKKAKRKTAKRAKMKSQRRQQEPIPSDPAGRVGLRRPSNVPFPPGRNRPRELAQAEPDSRFGDRREPEANAREHPGGSMPPLERRGGYKNTDEQF